MCEGAVGLETFFLIFAWLMLVETVLSIAAVGEIGTLNKVKGGIRIGQAVFFIKICH